MMCNRKVLGRRNINSSKRDRNEPGMGSPGNWNSRLRSEASIPARIFFVLLGLCLACAFPQGLDAQTAVFTSAQVAFGSGLQNPEQVAVDGAGDVFIADTNNNRVVELPAGGGAQVTVPTTGLSNPQGVAVDGAGDVFIADTGNNRVVEVSAGSGVQTTIPTTGLVYPLGLAVDGAGDLFISDNGNRRVVEAPAGGGAQITKANVPYPRGIAVDGAGDLFVADQMDGAWEFPHGGGAAIPLGTGISIAAWVALDGAGDVFITDAGNNRVVRLPAGGGPQVMVPATGLSVPVGVAVSATGIVYFGDNGNNRVVEVQTGSANFGSMNVCPASQMSPAPCSQTLTLNYSIPTGGDIATAAPVTLGEPNLDFKLASGSTCTGHFNAGGSCVVNVTFAPTRAGLRQGAVQITDDLGNVLATTYVYGIGNAPQIAFPSGKQTTIGSNFNYPEGVATDGAGNTYVADSNTNEVYKIPAGGGAQTTVGTGLNSPAGVAVDGAGNVFIADQENWRVVEVPAGGGAQTTVGNVLSPVAVAVDGAGDVFIVDLGEYAVYKVPAGGGAQISIGTGLVAPQGVAVDAAGNVFIADSGNNRVVEVPTDGSAQTTVIGGLFGPTGVSVDAAGNVYVADYGNNRILQVDVEAGTHTVLATGLKSPSGVAVDSSGNVFIADTGNARVVELPRSQPPALSFVSTELGTTSTDSPKSAEVENIGNMPLNLTGVSYPADFPENPAQAGSEESCTGSTILAPGQACTLPVDFTPLHGGARAESLKITDNALNAAGAVQSIGTSGKVLGLATVAALASSLDPSVYGEAVKITATVKPVGGSLTPAGAVQFTVDGSPAGSPVVLTAGGAAFTSSALRVGTHSIGAVFTPASGSGFSPSSATALRQVVKKAKPAVTWPTPKAIAYGKALSATQLDASSNVAGSFAYTPTPGTVLKAGSHTLSVTFTPTDATDYQTVTATVALTVNKAELTVFPHNLSSVYGSPLPALTYVLLGFVNGDTQADAVTGAPELTTTATPHSAAGTYPIVASQGTLAAANYTFKCLTETMTISKAILTVAAHSLSKVYDAALPTLTYALSGFVNGDTAATAVTGSASLSTTATAKSAVGSYPITVAVGTLAAKNYSFQFKNGILTIKPIGTAATPTFTPVAGTYKSGQTVTIQESTKGAAVYYTTDGAAPTASSTKYSDGFTVSSTETVKAIAMAEGYTNSAVATAAYTIK